MSVVKEIKKGNKILRISIDPNPSSPREEDNLGTMVCWHRSYDLGDKHDFTDPEDFKSFVSANKERIICLPVYMFDHSGITISTEPFGCNWDSGQIGWIYITRKKIEKEFTAFGYNKTDEEIKQYLKNEIESYDMFLKGEIYGFELLELETCECCGNTEEKDIDSCWGFYGDDLKENGMTDHFTDDIIKLFEL